MKLVGKTHMFLERKFRRRDAHHKVAQPGREAARLPGRVLEVVHNLELLLATKRGVGHVLPDFGFSQSGHWSAEGLFTHYSRELRENVARYEPRLTLLEIDGELGDDGRPELVVEAEVAGVEGVFRIVIDLVRACIARVGPG
jgi:predicted component of type VI protein secretion system